MRKVMVIGCFIAGFLLLIPSSIGAMGYSAHQSIFENQIEKTDVTVYVRGGLGIHIFVYGISDETAVGIVTKGLFLPGIDSDSDWDHVYIYISTMAFIPSTFQLDITVYGQTFSYKGNDFFLFIWGITPN